MTKLLTISLIGAFAGALSACAMTSDPMLNFGPSNSLPAGSIQLPPDAGERV